MKKIFLILLLLSVFASIAASQDAPKKVLLAMENTKFKKALIEEMKKGLEKKSIQVTVVENHKKDLKNYRASDFDYVFITNSGVGSKVRPWIVKWLDDNGSSSNILLHTTKIKEWEEKVEVDAVSSASENDNASMLAEEYIKLLLEKK